jgi:hypothetical protein
VRNRRRRGTQGLAKSRIITGPTIGGDRVFVTMGMRGPLLAVPTRGDGERRANQAAWRYDKGTPDSCSPVLWRELRFIISDKAWPLSYLPTANCACAREFGTSANSQRKP